ncbi:MAG: hypothetical protein IJ391_02720 [Clostridia bacterium]|nr:hypothetical protein [Clostridia bacterium]
MIKETHFENIKNSNGERASIRHYIMDNDSDATMLPEDAPVGSDAMSKNSVYIKFPEGWTAI